MKIFLLPVLILGLFILSSCADILSEDGEENLSYIECEWFFCANNWIDTLNWNNFLLPFWIIDTTARVSKLYNLIDATDTPRLWTNDSAYGSDELRTEIVSKYIHYFKEEKLIRFQRLSETGTETLQIDFFNEIQYKEKESQLVFIND